MTPVPGSDPPTVTPCLGAALDGEESALKKQNRSQTHSSLLEASQLIILFLFLPAIGCNGGSGVS